MTIEEKLKELILSRYKSVREFAIIADMPPTTVRTILNRGVDNSSLSNIIQVCRVLNISVDELANGNIVPKPIGEDNSTVEVASIVDEMKSRFTLTDHITVNGKEVNDEFADTIIDILDIGYEMIKTKSKKDKKSE